MHLWQNRSSVNLVSFASSKSHVSLSGLDLMGPLFNFMVLVFFFFFLTAACGILVLDQGLNLHALQQKNRVLTAGPPGKSQFHGSCAHFLLLLVVWTVSMCAIKYVK